MESFPFLCPKCYIFGIHNLEDLQSLWSMYQLWKILKWNSKVCSKPFCYGFLWLLMSSFLSYGEEQQEGIQQGIRKKKSELSLSTVGNLPLQPPDPICVSKRGWQKQLFSKCWNSSYKDHSNLHLNFKWYFVGLFHSCIVD